MNSPIYHKGESAYLTNDHLRILLGPDNTDETPESLRQNPGRLEELYNLRKLHTPLHVQAVKDKLLHWQGEGSCWEPRNLSIDEQENDTLEQSTSPDKEFPYFRHPDYFYYIELIQDGGRPAMPFGLFMQIWANPEPEWQNSVSTWKDVLRCREILPYAKRADSLFGWQWRRWRLFRDWQYTNRNIIHGDFVNEVDVEEYNRFFEFNLQENTRINALNGIGISADGIRDEILREGSRVCSAIKGFRNKFLTHPHTTDSNAYVEAVHRRLRRRAYSAKVHLRANPKHQDDLATWLEYVAFEIWFSETHQKNSRTELHKVSYEFLATWALAQIPLVEEQTRTSRDQKEAWSRSMPVDEETFGFATKWEVHHQDTTVAVRDFAIPACRVPREVALEHVLGIPAEEAAAESQLSEPSPCNQPKLAASSKTEKPPIPKLIVWDASSSGSLQEQPVQDRTRLVAHIHPRRKLKRTISSDAQPDERHKRRRVVEDDQAAHVRFDLIQPGPIAADGLRPAPPAGEAEERTKENGEGPVGRNAITESSCAQDKDHQRYIKDVFRGLRRSDRIRDMKVAKRSKGKSETSEKPSTAKRRKLKK